MQTQPTLQERADFEAEIALLRAENERLKSKPKASNGFKVSEKGGVSLYGLGRFPVTLYASQWERLLGLAPQIQEFIQANIETITARAEAHAKKKAESETAN